MVEQTFLRLDAFVSNAGQGPTFPLVQQPQRFGVAWLRRGL
jgi:hypothetical protein